MWSDCSGKATELYAARSIAAKLQATFGIEVEFVLYAACDNTRHCKDFIMSNYNPQHFADDIFKRNFDAASFKCTICNKGACFMPACGYDIYSCFFPCGPWSKLGNRLGLDDPNGNVVWQTIRTIKHMQPVMFIMENVMEISTNSTDPGTNDRTQIKDFMDQQLGASYYSMTISNISPIQAGYPTEKKRFLVLGGRNDSIVPHQLTNIFAKMIANPVPVTHTYFTFLGLQRIADEVADHIGALPGADLASSILLSGCMCSIDPYVVCPQHPCICTECKKEGDGAEIEMKCAWRRKAEQFICENKLLESKVDGRVTYLQALELIGGLQGPKSPRERNLLNLLALLPAADPLRSTMMIMDISQAIDRARPKFDGTVPTMGTNARMWSMKAGRLLTVSEMAKLMGVDIRECNLEFTTECQMRRMLGMSIHVGTSGFALIGLLAAVGAYGTGCCAFS